MRAIISFELKQLHPILNARRQRKQIILNNANLLDHTDHWYKSQDVKQLLTFGKLHMITSLDHWNIITDMIPEKPRQKLSALSTVSEIRNRIDKISPFLTLKGFKL